MQLPDDRLELDGSRCGLWWRGAGQGGERVGAIGELALRDAASGAALLERACRLLAARSCTAALGPMDGSTWRSYRAVVESDGTPPFYKEPAAGMEVAGAFAHAGFGIASRYVSSVEEPIRASRVVADADGGCVVRAFDRSRAEEELRRLHPLCMAAFAPSPHFTPLEMDAFVALHAPLARALDPRLSFVAEREGVAVGFLLAFPNRVEADQRAGPTLILKTLAVDPGRQAHGVGRRLAEALAGAGIELGYRRAIHALMHESNASAGWSARRGRPFRRYALFRRELASR